MRSEGISKYKCAGGGKALNSGYDNSIVSGNSMCGKSKCEYLALNIYLCREVRRVIMGDLIIEVFIMVLGSQENICSPGENTRAG